MSSWSHQFVLLRHVGTQVEPLDVQLADVLLATCVSAAQVGRGPLGLLDCLGPRGRDLHGLWGRGERQGSQSSRTRTRGVQLWSTGGANTATTLCVGSSRTFTDCLEPFLDSLLRLLQRNDYLLSYV